MANPDAALGFQPYRARKGEDTPTQYKLLSSNVTIRIGDLVTLDSNGYVDCATSGGEESDVIGVSAEYRANAAGATAATNTLLVWDNPFLKFKVQTVSGTSFSQAMVGDQCDHVQAAGSDIYSGAELNIASLIGDGGTAQFKILGLCREPNNTMGTHANVVVQFAEHFLLPSTLAKAI